MAITILTLPFLGFILTFLCGIYWGREASVLLSTNCIFLSWYTSFLLLIEYITTGKIYDIVFVDWIVTIKLHLQLGLVFDGISLIMCFIITSISFCVHLYACSYMAQDPYTVLFIAYLSLFTFFMLLLVTANNLIFMYFGWEGVGIMSYLLINHWTTRSLANKAALKAMIVNRISDAFFFIGILILLTYYGTINFSELSTIINNNIDNSNYIVTGFSPLNIACVFLLFGVFGKSAQIFFHVWLPDAMEGPTPVSALLHAATMVTAGVILLLRCSLLLAYCSSILQCITLFGSVTASMAAFASVFQMDIKKVIAYSTCSQLGYMIMSCGLCYYNVALFHLFNHAFFKALLFLGAGSVIHAVSDEQDMRKMGGLINFLPFTFFSMLIGSVAIMGVPFLSGFYSKDLMLELTYNSYFLNSIILYYLSLFAAFCTALYSTRMLLFVFLFKSKSHHVIFAEEAENYMTTAISILFILSIFVGFIFSDTFVGLGNKLLSDTIFILPLNYYYTNQFIVGPIIKNFPLINSLAACLIAFIIIKLIINKKMYNKKLYYTLLNTNSKLSSLSYNALYFNIIYNDGFVSSYYYSYDINTKLIDKGIYEFLGPVGVYRFLYKLSSQIKLFNPSIFLSLGFMFSSLVFMYCYLVISLYIIPYYTCNMGIFITVFIIFYYESNYSKN